MLKYEMIPEGGRFRIKALIDIDCVKQGALGGLIERERNLSQEGNARVYDDARVSGNARVSGDAHVFGNARVFGNSWASGDARVFGNAQVFGNSLVSGTPLTLSGLTWCVTITDNHIQIGCELHTKKEWAAFSDDRISKMAADALQFWSKYKKSIMLLAGENL